VSVEDAAGNVVTSATNSITLAIGTNPASGTLGGTLTVAAVSGVATFSTLTVDNSGAAYTLSASATGFTTVSSAAFNVTGSCTSNCTISGTVSGPTVSGVAVALTGPSSANTTTDGSGNYTFAGLAAGTYTVTPTLAGYTFTPVAPNVTISASTMTQNFTETSAVGTFSISGTLTYAGVKTGRTFIRVSNTNTCNNNGCESAGTSLSTAPTSGGVAYTVRGLSPGTYNVAAEVDTLNNGAPNASNPWGAVGGVTISTANITGENITLTDPTPPAPVTPSGLTVTPGSSLMLVQYNQHGGSNTLQDSNGREIATSYKVYYDTSSSFTHGTFVTISAHGTHDDNVIISSLISGTYFVKMTALVGVTESAATSTVSATLANGTGAFTVSGVVNFPGTATGPLYVGLLDQTNNKIYAKKIASPTTGVAYSLTGVPAGSYQAFAIIDQNSGVVGQAGVILSNDISNVNNNQGGPPPLTVSGNTTNNITLTSAVTTLTATTSNNQTNGGPHFYNIGFNVEWGSKRPVAITVASGPNISVPWDVPADPNNGYQAVIQNSAVPLVGDTYQFQVTFSDGTTQTIPVSITGVLNSFPTGLAMNSPVAGTTTVPVLNWVTPAAPPSSYTYQVGLFSVSGSTNVQWNDSSNNGNGIPSGTTNVTFNEDSSATANGSSITSLPSGTNYNWFVEVQDSNGNTAQENATYNIP
jgi:hypothetical protein